MDLEMAAALGIVDTGAPAEAFAQPQRPQRPASRRSPLRGVTRLERLRSETMDAHLAGDSVYFVEKEIENYAYRCDSCGLVWDKRHRAEQCAARGHKSSFRDGPYGVSYVLNGVPQGRNIHYYTRTALRREKLAK
jgi:hypothetical protein